MKYVTFNKESEAAAQDGIAPNQLIYVGLIKNLPPEIKDEIGDEIRNGNKPENDSIVVFGRILLPSYFEIGDKVNITFGNSGCIVNAEVIQVHFTISKVKYDVEVLLGNRAGENFITRVYNLDSALLTKANGKGVTDFFTQRWEQENFEPTKTTAKKTDYKEHDGFIKVINDLEGVQKGMGKLIDGARNVSEQGELETVQVSLTDAYNVLALVANYKAPKP